MTTMLQNILLIINVLYCFTDRLSIKTCILYLTNICPKNLSNSTFINKHQVTEDLIMPDFRKHLTSLVLINL